MFSTISISMKSSRRTKTLLFFLFLNVPGQICFSHTCAQQGHKDVPVMWHKFGNLEVFGSVSSTCTVNLKIVASQ